MNWLGVIGAVINLVFLILKNIGEKDAEEKKKKEALHAEAMEAIKSNDKSRVTAVFDKLRK